MAAKRPTRKPEQTATSSSIPAFSITAPPPQPRPRWHRQTGVDVATLAGQVLNPDVQTDRLLVTVSDAAMDVTGLALLADDIQRLQRFIERALRVAGSALAQRER